jgi:hypothetical protein
VVADWIEAGLFARLTVVYLATDRVGTLLEKLMRAIFAVLNFVALLLRMRRYVLHVQGASSASFWRKAPFM